MLWYRWWLQTRWRFVIGLAVLLCSAASIVIVWPRIVELMPLASKMQMGGELGRKLKEAAEVSREYRGYIWAQWFQQNGAQLGTLFAVLLGTGGVFSQRAGALFTLSLPVSRERLLGTRIVIGLGELLALALVPSIFILLLSPTVGKTYDVREALVHSLCLFVVASVFYSLAFLLSALFNDLWRPLMFALLAALLLALLPQVFRNLSPYSAFRVMSGESFFRSGTLPWLGLLASATASIAMLYGAVIRTVRQDF